MFLFKKFSDQPAIGIAQASLIRDRIDADYYKPIFVENEECLRNSGINLINLGDMWGEASYGSLPDSADYAEKGISLIRGTDIRGFGITPEEDLVKVPSHYFDRYKKAQINEGEILLLVKGASIDRPDSTAIVPKLNNKTIINGSVFRIKLMDAYDKYYVAAFMFSRYFLQQKRRAVTNTGALYNDLDTIKSYLIPIPDPQIQSYIGSKVRLAEKCREEANNNLCEATTELFKEIEWPIKLYETQSHLVEIEDISDRLDAKYYKRSFLDTIKHIENLNIGFNKLAEYVDSISNGFEYRDFVANGIPYLTVSDINKGRIDSRNSPRIPSSVSITSRGHLKENDVLVVRTGSIGQAAFVSQRNTCSVISSHFIRLRLKDSSNGPWIAFYLNSEIGKLLQERIAYGAVQPQIGQDELLNLPIPRLSKEKAKSINNLILRADLLIDSSYDLIEEAKSDVEKLIEDKLDTEGIISDRIKAPTWDEIEAELQKEVEADA